MRPTADLQRVAEHATIGKADDGTVAGKGERSPVGFFSGAQETKAAVAEVADVSKGAENTFGSSGFDSDDGLEHGDHGSDHGDLSVGNAGDYDQSSTLPDKGYNVKWRRLARRAGARTAERAELIAQRLSDRFEQLRGDDEGMPNWQQHMVDEINTFLAWTAHCQTEDCTFEDYQGWRPPLRPRRRRIKR